LPLSGSKGHAIHKGRYVLYISIIIVFFTILGVRLWYMQIVKGNHYRHLSENNRIRQRTIKASRGLIFDRNGEILVNNYPYFDLAVIPENVPDVDDMLNTLSNVIEIDKDELKNKMYHARFKPAFKPVVLIEDLSREQLSLIEANKLNLPGIEIYVESVRNYPYNDMASHIIGYLSEINAVKMKLKRYEGYKLGDLIGSVGVEKIYESILKGEDGLKEIEVDAFGRELSSFTNTEAQPGGMLYLTLDARLQKYVESVLADQKAGAIVVTDVNNGQILAQYSKPNFDPSFFVKGISSKNWKVLNEDPLHPLQNKAVAGQYSPGSVFKIVVAAAALDEGFIKKDTEFNCPGSYRFGNSRFSCWRKSGHGKVNVVEAIEQSCDVFFYNLGAELGIDLISEYARKMGLGRPTGIDLENEKQGLMPTTEWKKRVLKSVWFGGETISSAIGQSYVLVTPLQTAMLLATVANGEYISVPQLFLKAEETDGTVIRKSVPVIRKKLRISKETMEIVREGLFDVVNGEKGTARGSKPKKVKAAGKTGTVQVFSEKMYAKKKKETDEEKKKELDYELRDHAWFACYAPVEKPEIAIAVIVEHGGHGASAAAPLAKKIINFYYSKIKGDDDSV